MLYACEISQNPATSKSRRPFSTIAAAMVGTVSTAARALMQSAKYLTAPRLYRLELRAARAVASLIESRPRLFNALLWALGILFALEVFMCAPID